MKYSVVYFFWCLFSTFRFRWGILTLLFYFIILWFNSLLFSLKWWTFMYSLVLIIFVVSEKKAFEHFPIGSNVNLCIPVLQDLVARFQHFVSGGEFLLYYFTLLYCGLILFCFLWSDIFIFVLGLRVARYKITSFALVLLTYRGIIPFSEVCGMFLCCTTRSCKTGILN
jgi:hypothetical protein